MKQYNFICECWDKSNSKKIVREDAETAAAIKGGLHIGAGVGGVILRNKRHAIIFEKVMQKYPHAKDMIKFLQTRGLYTKGLTPDTPDNFYAEWVKRQIVKEGNFWRIFAQVFFFGIPTGVYNAIKYSSDKEKNADELITNALH